MTRNAPERVMAWLRKGPIFPLMMWQEEGIYRVAYVIERLRKRGHVIGTRMIDYTRSDGRRVQYAEYVLVKEAK